MGGDISGFPARGAVLGVIWGKLGSAARVTSDAGVLFENSREIGWRVEKKYGKVRVNGFVTSHKHRRARTCT